MEETELQDKWEYRNAEQLRSRHLSKNSGNDFNQYELNKGTMITNEIIRKSIKILETPHNFGNRIKESNILATSIRI